MTTRPTLAYVFWHWPAPGTDRAAYEDAMRAFHTALALPGSRTFRLDRAPFATDEPGAPYEDWYPVADWAALGALNERAMTGRRRGPHDAAARLSRTGAGAVYRLLHAGGEDATVTWHTAPPPRDQPATVWQRQMVLGPAPEFLVCARLDGGRQVRRDRL